MQADPYYSIPRMSNSALKHFRRSPRHYLTNKQFPVVTEAMVIGQAFHAFILEPDKFTGEFAVAPVCDRRTKEGKSTYAEFQLTLKPGQQIIFKDDMAMIERMRESLYDDAHARELLDSVAWAEKPFEWTDDITGVECKAKMDAGNDVFTLDLKSCENADPFTFASYAYNNLLTQPAMYVDARGANKMNKGAFYFICIEKSPPYGVSVLKVGNDFIKEGRAVYGEILSDYAYWLEMGSPDVCYSWKAPLGYHMLNLPKWKQGYGGED